MVDSELLWKPILEAAAQTLIGALGSLTFGKLISNLKQKNTYDGAMDLWARGIRQEKIGENSNIYFDGIISPYSQLFPGDPFNNGQKWNTLYMFEGKISKHQYQAMEFFSGSDAALRVGSFNGETLVGLYARYGFIGEGIIGVVPTMLLRKKIPQFFESSFFGTRAMIKATLSKCPSQLGYVAQTIALKGGIEIDTSYYKNLWYLKIKDIDLYTKPHEKTLSLLGTSWAVTDKINQQYLIQYGYFSDQTELKNCIDQLQLSNAWKHTQVFYDDLKSPAPELSFKKRYML